MVRDAWSCEDTPQFVAYLWDGTVHCWAGVPPELLEDAAVVARVRAFGRVLTEDLTAMNNADGEVPTEPLDLSRWGLVGLLQPATVDDLVVGVALFAEAPE